MGVAIFILSISSLFYPYYHEEKDADYLSEYYFSIHFDNEKMSIGDLLNTMDTQKMLHITFLYNWSDGKATNFTNSFFKEIGANLTKDMKSDNEPVALVNQDEMEICIEENGERFIQSNGQQYRVIGTFEDLKKDGMSDTAYYINLNSDVTRKDCNYEYMLCDFETPTDLKKVEKSVANKVKAVQPVEWSGVKTTEEIVVRDVYAVVILIVAIVICVNCVGFMDSWIRNSIYEFSVRKLVGAHDFSNLKLMMKRFCIVFTIAAMVGCIIDLIIYRAFSKIEYFQIFAGIFDNRIRLGNMLSGVLFVFVIGIITLNIRYFMIRNSGKMDIRRY
ncbi:MAG: hypothetical protein K6G01_02010 [Eubacterium sp.]|nr:hypothetical protein [Eubacterium sp.]